VSSYFNQLFAADARNALVRWEVACCVSEGQLLKNMKLQSRSMVDVLKKRYRWKDDDALEFVDFLLPMLRYDRRRRATATQCLNHPWLHARRPPPPPGPRDPTTESDPNPVPHFDPPPPPVADLSPPPPALVPQVPVEPSPGEPAPVGVEADAPAPDPKKITRHDAATQIGVSYTRPMMPPVAVDETAPVL